LKILKDKCFLYNNQNELYDIFKMFKEDLENIKNKDWNAYRDYTPENIINKFNQLFIKPCINN
jgi:hypothetical protein